MIKIKWLEEWKDRIHKQGYAEGYNAHKQSIVGIREEEKKVAFQQGRNFEFKTMINHLEGMFKQQMSQNVEWVVQRFREITEVERITPAEIHSSRIDGAFTANKRILSEREANVQKKV